MEISRKMRYAIIVGFAAFITCMIVGFAIVYAGKEGGAVIFIATVIGVLGGVITYAETYPHD